MSYKIKNLRSGFSYITTTVVVKKYIPELIKKLKEKGVNFITTKINTLQEVIKL